jgi:hypothetical protein
MHYLKAVKAAGTDETGPVLKVMKEQPVNDFMTHNGHIRADGRLLRDVYIFRVKSPTESKGEWDLFQQIDTIPAGQAFKPTDPTACDLVKIGPDRFAPPFCRAAGILAQHDGRGAGQAHEATSAVSAKDRKGSGCGWTGARST